MRPTPDQEISSPPVIRTVRLTIQLGLQNAFLDAFRTHATDIRKVPGCQHLEIWQDRRYPNIYCTLSYWESERALEEYRSSDLFKQAWQAVKKTFAAPPQVFSYMTVPDTD